MKAELVLGEVVYATFRPTTECADLRYLASNDAGNRLRRPNSFDVTAVSARGQVLRVQDVPNDEGGGEGMAQFGPKYEQTLTVDHWLTFPASGTHDLRVHRSFSVGHTRQDLQDVVIDVSTPIVIAK